MNSYLFTSRTLSIVKWSDLLNVLIQEKSFVEFRSTGDTEELLRIHMILNDDEINIKTI
jgi:hypothetical protein